MKKAANSRVKESTLRFAKYRTPGLRRSLLAAALCSGMLGVSVVVLMPRSAAQSLFSELSTQNRPDDKSVVEALLGLPAPPPPNPLDIPTLRDEDFYDPKHPPADDAPIDDLIDYWSRQSETNQGSLYYLARPSAKVADRLLSAIEADPSRFSSLSKILPDDTQTADTIKRIYDSLGNKSADRDLRNGLKDWLKLNSPYFIEELEQKASSTRDVRGYIDSENENNVIALTKYDWDRAKPIVERMYNDASNPVTKVLATWALYKHALLSNDLGDIDRYRSELMRTVEDKNQPDGVRDKANDAIAHEADFPGRDDWTFSLFEDETLVKMNRYTMLTTLVMYDPPDKHVSKLIALLENKSKLVRLGAVLCLMTAFQRDKNPDIVRAILPWVSDPKWVDIEPESGFRISIVQQLASLKMQEAVPALIAALDETATRTVAEDGISITNTNANIDYNSTNANRAIAYYSTTNTNTGVYTLQGRSNSNIKTRVESYFPLRDPAVQALGFQADARAVPALRRLLNSTKEPYKIEELIRATFACGGYAVSEQVDALEYFVRRTGDLVTTLKQLESQGNAESVQQYLQTQMSSLMTGFADERRDERYIVGSMVSSNDEPSALLATAVIDRIQELEKKEPQVAQSLRHIIVNWKGTAISALLLRDLKAGRADSHMIVRLLAERKSLSEKLAAEVADARTANPIAGSIGACIVNDEAAFQKILDSKIIDAHAALYACARLIRAGLPLDKAAADLKSDNPSVKSAAELYIESNDSPAARSILLSQYPNEARILGATRFFPGKNGRSEFNPQLLNPLFASVTGAIIETYLFGEDYDPAQVGKLEERLRKEVREDALLSGIYSYKGSFIRLYKDRVVFSWEDDPARYHERILTKEESEAFKSYLAANNVSEMKPFVSCNGGCGTSRELLMLGKSGGSRVFVQNERTPLFFLGLEKLFDNFRAAPAEIKYSLAKEVPGLEVLFATDDLAAETVWKQGSDLRVVVGNPGIREKIDEEIARLEDSEQANVADKDEELDEEGRLESNQPATPSERMRLRRRFDEYQWHSIENRRLGSFAAQPPGVEFIPPPDSLDMQPSQDQWKARAKEFGIRIGSDGIYRVALGKAVKILSGDYSSPVVSSDGRWLIVHKFDEENGSSVVRYDLQTKRQYPIRTDLIGELFPACFVNSIGKFLMATKYYEDEHVSDDDEDTPDEMDRPRPPRYFLLDPASGALTPAPGEIRPLIQQTFRPLQLTGRPDEFWAAIPSGRKHETLVGLYDARRFQFTPLRRLPKIHFNSMTMWVDADEQRIYFVYGGHLLRVPLK